MVQEGVLDAMDPNWDLDSAKEENADKKCQDMLETMKQVVGQTWRQTRPTKDEVPSPQMTMLTTSALFMWKDRPLDKFRACLLFETKIWLEGKLEGEGRSDGEGAPSVLVGGWMEIRRRIWLASVPNAKRKPRQSH